MIDHPGRRVATRVERRPAEPRPVSRLLQDTATHVENVVRGEVQLTIAKARDEVTSVARASLWRAVGGVFGLIGYVLLMVAAAAFLELYLARWQGLLILALLNLAVAAGLVLRPSRARDSGA